MSDNRKIHTPQTRELGEREGKRWVFQGVIFQTVGPKGLASLLWDRAGLDMQLCPRAVQSCC